jgi:competence protein ComEA
MSYKKILQDYFRFTRRDRLGVLALTILILMAWGLPRFFPRQPPSFPVLWETRVMDTASAIERAGYTDTKMADPYSGRPAEAAYIPGALFRFDPNTLSEEGWKKLGLPYRSIRTLLKFRSKGGRFYKSGDLQRVWGMPSGFFERVKDYQDLPQSGESTDWKKEEPARPMEVYPKKIIQPVAVNAADSASFEALPGIGARLAGRLVAFRNRLGGFYSVDQVGEVYGLADSVFQKFRSLLRLDGAVTKININTATKEMLKVHPYIRWALANAIVAYRNQHGPFHEPSDLLKITLIDEATLNKLLPYLSF